MSKADFQNKFDVSRETMDRLECYEVLIQKWNPKINLIASSTLSEIWNRHFLDSGQLVPFAPTSGTWLDLGSGGGFPALVIASMTKDTCPELSFTLVESDTRKAVFLRAVIRELGLNANVLSDRIEKTSPQNVGVVSARALGPLSKLIEYAEIHLNQDGIALFPKGSSHKSELEQALECWSFHVQTISSVTDQSAAIFAIKDIRRVK
jgi:16S rRNA (guanine527-N7)-methyltransferase